MIMNDNFGGVKLKSVTLLLAPLAYLLVGGSLAYAQDKEKALAAPPAIFTDMVNCKSIADPQARLACYDEKVGAFETAQNKKEVVVADREQVREARKGLFGLSLPRIRLFGGEGDEGADIQQIESTIKQAAASRDRKWLLTLEDGAVWRQTDVPRSTAKAIKPGDAIVIERGSLGSFTAKVNDGRPFKVIRVVN